MTIDHAARYWAYANYLIALSSLIKQEYPSNADLVGTLAGYQGIQRLSRSNEIDIKPIAKALQTALCHIVQSTLFIFEVIIVKSLSKQLYAGILAEFMATPWGTAAAQTAFDRWTAIESSW